MLFYGEIKNFLKIREKNGCKWKSVVLEYNCKLAIGLRSKRRRGCIRAIIVYR